MQTPFSGKRGILPALPRAIHVESGIVGKRRLPDGNDCHPAFFNDFVLDVYVSRNFCKMIFTEEAWRR